jgi:AraC-like DNA-binding protein
METYPLVTGDAPPATAMPSDLIAPDVRPASTGRHVAGGRPAPLLSVVRLLDKAGQALGRDKSDAYQYIEKAAALLRAQSTTDAPEQPAAARSRLAPWQVTRATRFIDANLDQKIAIREIAETARLSPSHFSRAFRATVGLSPHAYVIRRRVGRAQQMIRGMDASLSEIALECGFSDQAHLTKLFRRVVGVSPGAWRRAQSRAAGQLAA